MSFPSLLGTTLETWFERTSQGWKEFLAQYPDILNLPCDIRETRSVAQLLQHIVAVELRYAERLHALPETSYGSIQYDTVDAIYAIHAHAMDLLGRLEDKSAEYWHEAIQITTRSSGSHRARRSDIFFHLQLHSIRHYAQLATLVRQHGFAPSWPMDYLFTNLLSDIG